MPGQLLHGKLHRGYVWQDSLAVVLASRVRRPDRGVAVAAAAKSVNVTVFGVGGGAVLLMDRSALLFDTLYFKAKQRIASISERHKLVRAKRNVI